MSIYSSNLLTPISTILHLITLGVPQALAIRTDPLWDKVSTTINTTADKEVQISQVATVA